MYQAYVMYRKITILRFIDFHHTRNFWHQSFLHFLLYKISPLSVITYHHQQENVESGKNGNFQII